MNIIFKEEFNSEVFRKKGFIAINGKDIILDKKYSNDILEFKYHYNNLNIDNYILEKEKRLYRNRQYIKFILKQNKIFTISRDCDFFQDKGINTIYGGYKRIFEPITDYICKNKFLHELILFDLNNISKVSKNKNWEIGVHMIRITIENNQEVSYPTPEGVHQDGFPYIVQHFIDKQNIDNDISTIYTLNKEKIESIVFKSFLDTMYVLDDKVMHGVSPIIKGTSSLDSYRDMLILTFAPI